MASSTRPGAAHRSPRWRGWLALRLYLRIYVAVLASLLVFALLMGGLWRWARRFGKYRIIARLGGGGMADVFLAQITLPFAFFGVDSYVRNVGAGSDLASVGDTKITIPQFELALREHQDQLRQKLGASFKLEMMNSPEVRQGVLEALIDRRLLLLEVEKHRLLTSDNALREAISKIPALQEDGQFSMARYE